MSAGIEVTRRVFLRSVSALAICVSVPRLALSQGALPRSLEVNPNLDTWLRINADGTVSIWTGKAELGQGIRTALAQIAAEELDVAFERIRIEAVDTARSPSEGRTTGSVSIERSGAAIRMASAEARQLLLQNAAGRLNIPAERLSVNDGQVLADGRDAELSYRELLSDAAFDTRATASVAPKRPDQHRIVGTPQERIDLPAKFFGEPAYVHDLRLPGMLHARVVRPEMDSARLTAVESEAVSGMDGVVAVVRDGSFLAVVAATGFTGPPIRYAPMPPGSSFGICPKKTGCRGCCVNCRDSIPKSSLTTRHPAVQQIRMGTANSLQTTRAPTSPTPPWPPRPPSRSGTARV